MDSMPALGAEIKEFIKQHFHQQCGALGASLDQPSDQSDEEGAVIIECTIHVVTGILLVCSSIT